MNIKGIILEIILTLIVVIISFFLILMMAVMSYLLYLIDTPLYIIAIAIITMIIGIGVLMFKSMLNID